MNERKFKERGKGKKEWGWMEGKERLQFFFLISFKDDPATYIIETRAILNRNIAMPYRR